MATAKKKVAAPAKTARRGKATAEEVEAELEEATGAGKRKRGAKGDAPTFDVAALYAETIDEVSRRQNFDADLLEDMPPMSTGLLSLDLIHGGGIRPAWYTHYGPEQSAKTTGALTIMAAAIKAAVPIIGFADYEGSTKNSKPYVGSILKTAGVKVSVRDVFGRKDPTTGKYIVPPVVRYRSETVGEKFFDWLADILRKLPDKRKINGKWWLVYERTKVNIAKLSAYADKGMPKKYGDGLWIPAPDAGLQALILTDSYPGMNPSSNDEEDSDNSLALQARMFSKHIPRVKGRLAQKMVAVIGINQLRKIPMARYGPTEDEPCGQALKFNCMVGDTLLFTERGMVTAEEAFLEKPKMLCGRSGLEQPLVFDKMGYSEIVSITTKSGLTVAGKPGHMILTLNQNSLTPEFTSLNELLDARTRVQKYVAVKVGSQIFPKKNVKLRWAHDVSKYTGNDHRNQGVCFPSELNPDLAWAFGVLCGDGYVRDGHVLLVNDDLEVIEKFARVIKDNFNLSISGHLKKGSKRIYEAGFYCTAVGAFLAYCGLGNKSSHTKEVPWTIRQGTREVQAAFLAGHIDSDCFHTVSKTLFQQLSTMLLNFGILGTDFSGKESFWSHGHTSERDSVAQVRRSTSKHGTSERAVFHVNFYNPYVKVLDEVVDKYQVNEKRRARRKASIAKDTGVSRQLGVLPVSDNPWRTEASKLVQLFDRISVKERREHALPAVLRADSSGYAVIDYLRTKIVPALRTVQERHKAEESLVKYKAFLDTVTAEKLVFVPIHNASIMHERLMTYDGNMPETSTIVTNGIVSHNSDSRLRWYPRASGMPLGAKFNQDDKLEHEKSVEYEGTDRYRYIHVKATKNKMWTPGREGWLRIWVEDASGTARGFDPVFDTLFYLKATGQLKGKNGMDRKFLQLDLEGMGKAKKTIPWDGLKKWILGDKETKTKVCAYLGYKPFDLRKFCFRQMETGVAEELYVKVRQAAKEAGEDDEEGNEEE